MKQRLILFAFILCSILSSSVFTQNRTSLPIHLEVPITPMPFKADGRTHLLYELHITNFRSKALELTQIDIFSDELSAKSLASFSGATLAGMITNVGVRKKDAEKRTIDAGQRSVVFLQVSLDPKMPTPNVLRHRLYLKPAKSKAEPLTIEDRGFAVRTKTPPIISAPLKRGNWISFNGISNTSGHRRTIIPLNGSAGISQRFAIDWIKIGADGLPFKTSPAKNENFYGYASDIIAVADATVVDVKDGIPENDMTAGKPAVPITIETIGGNYVILDIGNGYFAFYAHMIPGSLRVRIGDRVKVGQTLGKLGNSGNSDAPHLHFHVTNANSPLGSEGVPYLINSFEVLGKVASPDSLFCRQGLET